MSIAILFWVLMLLRLVFCLWNGYVPGQPYPARVWGGSIFDFVLFAIIGWHVFGAPIR